MDNLPKINSWWMNNGNKNVYKVIRIANIDNLNPNYPPSVVYVGRSGSTWVKTLDNFLDKMTEVPIVTSVDHKPWIIWGQTKEEYLANNPEWKHPDEYAQY